MSDDIHVNFIIPMECEHENYCSEEMQLAFVACEQHSGSGLKANWLHENNCTEFDKLTKKDVFVLSEFSGQLYNKLKSTKCLLVGPRCLSCCLTEVSPIPSGPEPVFTIAMRGLVITASGLSKSQKEKIKQKIYWMGGIYGNALTEDTTHLISETVLSEKYRKSVEKGIPVMLESWVADVWERSLQNNVNGASSEFAKHKLPLFYNLQVTTSGIARKEKLTIMKLINENGGTFSGAFQSETTDIVVLNRDGIGSEKFKAAQEYGKVCVLPAWVVDSVARGIVLPVLNYRVTGSALTSSPLAHTLPDMSINISRITNVRSGNNFVNETRSTDISTLAYSKSKLSQDLKKNDLLTIDKDVLSAFENLNMSNLKQKDSIFDGFCIWVSGPEGCWRERACTCVSRGGGTRYDAPHERVTHVIAGSAAAAMAAKAALPSVPILSPLWLLDSITAGKALDETQYVMEERTIPKIDSPRKAFKAPGPESPMSKRNLQLLRRDRPAPPVFDAPQSIPSEPLVLADDDVLKQYLSQNSSGIDKEKAPDTDITLQQPNATQSLLEEPTEEIEQIFQEVRLEVVGVDEEGLCEVEAEITAAGGALVGPGLGTHVLVPLDFDVSEIKNSRAEPITVFWLKDCLSQQEIVPLQYYHRPVRVPEPEDGKPAVLDGVVLSISTYTSFERAFLDELARLLGAITQLRFCRRTTPLTRASTHLLCPTPTGDKYMGAVKWGLPAVTAQWLMDIAAAGRRVSEQSYLVGETKAPLRNETIEEPKEVIEKENLTKSQEVPNKENAVSRNSRDHTPQKKNNVSDCEGDMSPASRYIAMARQGLLSQETPKHDQVVKKDPNPKGECAVHTPPLEEALSTPNLLRLSPTTRRRLLAIRRGEMPSDPVRTPVDPFVKQAVDTPDSGFGAALRPGSGCLSPDARKSLWRVIQDLPSRKAPQKQVTPLSEIRNRFLAQFRETSTPPCEHLIAPRKLELQEQTDTPPAKIQKLEKDQGISKKKDSLPVGVDTQLQQLSAVLTGRSGSPGQAARLRRHRDSLQKTNPEPEAMASGEEVVPGPESQPNTVGWDDTIPHPIQRSEPLKPAPIRKFMMSSNVDNREELCAMIISLGAEVAEGSEMDPTATHLLCSAPGRSEKMLGSIAAGKWVLHPAYITRSRAHGSFLPEDDWEWGNDRASTLPQVEGTERALARAAYRWRSGKARGEPGPYCGMVALLHVSTARRRLLARLVQAGGGSAPDDNPPYSCDDITVCFADVKKYPLSARDADWLRSLHVPVCLPVLLSSYLTDEQQPIPQDHCLPEFRS